ncbi:hypothetical protein MBA17_02575 [Streptosporangium sp. KLBMP 9127]|nr:hypothetical protein [Streptosporangium sp. KLBMP 9127]
MSGLGLVLAHGRPVPGVLAHGVGARHDLPIPLFYAFAGAFGALMVSFVALGLLWADSRFRGGAAGRALRLGFLDGGVFRWGMRAAGLAATVFLLAVTVLGPDDPAVNPAAHLVYVVFWVGLVPASLLFGPVWKLLNPLRTVHLLLRVAPSAPLPDRLGYWPAAAGLAAFTWVELVSPDPASTTTLLILLTAYGTAQLAGSLRYGQAWFDRCDAFEVYSALIGSLSPLGRRDDGRIVVRNPLDGLDAVRPAPGLIATVCVMLGSTGYDGFAGSPWWTGVLQSGPLGPAITGTLGLSGAVMLVAVLYTACLGLAGLIGGTRGLTGAFAHSLVPIAVGYLVAHYFSLLVIEGQQAVIMASDPLGTGANLFGTAGLTADEEIVSPGTIAVVQVLAIVIGHVLGVVAAHDRSVRLLPPRAAVAGQIPLLVLMVCYTVGGLALLFAA